MQSKLIAVCLIFFSDRGFYFCEYLGFICFSVFCDLKKKNLMRKLSYLCNLLLTVWSYIFFFQFKIYLTLFSFLIQIYIMYFVSLKHCAACFCYISFWFVFTLLFWVKHVSIIWKCIKSKFSFFVARWYKSLFDKTFKGLLWFILESKFFCEYSNNRE